MKNIKSFKYWYSFEFDRFLKEYGYTIDDVKGYNVSSVMRYCGNILKTYVIYIYDGESVYFSIAYFKSFDEYNKAWLGFKDKLLQIYKKAAIKLYKLNSEYIRN